MKPSIYLHCFLVLLLCLPPVPCLAQDTTDCEELEKKILEFRNLESKAQSPAMKRLFNDSVLKLSEQFSRCLDGEIAVATEMQKAVASTGAAQGVEEHLNKLLKQRSDTTAEITRLRSSLGVAGPGSASEPGAVTPASSPTTRPTATARALARRTATAAPQGSPCAAAAAYDDAPGILKDLAMRSADDVVVNNNPDAAVQVGIHAVLYTVFDAASAKSSELVRDLDAYEYLGETARTDKQLGASAESDGAVSGIEKPGFAQLLGFAIEHGGITKANDGTNLTLSTSLYSLYSAFNKDTAENYARAGILNRVGVAATFAVEDKENELVNVRRNNLSEWSAKVRLFGDRSTRSPQFQRLFAERIRPRILDRLRTLGRAMQALAKQRAETASTTQLTYEDLEDNALNDAPTAIRERMACPDYVAATIPEKKQIVADLILGRLRTSVYEPVKNRSFELDDDEIAQIEGEFLPNLKRALDNLVLADKELKEAFDNLQKGPLTTFAYTNHRVPTASDYSETKFLYEQEQGFMGPMKLTANLGGSFYHRPNRSMNQQSVRDFSAALSFEGKSPSPFTESDDLSKITYSFVGRYQRLFENRRVPGRTPDIGALQFVTDVPVFRGFSFPFSVTYSNATEEEKKQGFRFNFGLRFDMDKFVELMRAGSTP